MGFRDLLLFNQEMLGKQAWRLITEPDSLCARVLKGRYFLSCDFGNAPRPRSSSATWKGILAGKELVQQGIQWGIGDGRSTKILVDNWIPECPPDKVSTLVPLPPNATVDFLMDEDSGTWDEETVRSFFLDYIAIRILGVPLSRFRGADFAYWPHAKLGVYTVKSAYNLVRSKKFVHQRSLSGRGLTIDSTEESKFWQKLWKIKAPGKMKISLWRLHMTAYLVVTSFVVATF
jgi:hypothetical protein